MARALIRHGVVVAGDQLPRPVPAPPSVVFYADLLRLGLLGFLLRLRILLSASIAVSSVSSKVPRYFWVVTMLE